MNTFLICDDHAMVREALISTVRATWPKLHVTAVGNFPDAWAAASDDAICLVDLSMPGASPVDGILRLRQTAPSMPIVVITGLTDTALLDILVGLGIRGLVHKSASTKLINDAIKTVMQGGSYLPKHKLIQPEGAADALRPLQTAQDQHLTPRQILVLQYVAHGLTNKDIARELGIAPATVKTHLSLILEKMHATTRAEAVQRGISLGILNL